MEAGSTWRRRRGATSGGRTWSSSSALRRATTPRASRGSSSFSLRFHARPFVGVSQSQLFRGLVSFWRDMPKIWLQERANSSKNQHGIPPRRAFCGSCSCSRLPLFRVSGADVGFVCRGAGARLHWGAFHCCPEHSVLTASQNIQIFNISPKSAAPDRQSLKSIGCSESTLPGNVLPRISLLT